MIPKKDGPNNGTNERGLLSFVILAILLTTVFNGILGMLSAKASVEVSYDTFMQMLSSGRVQEVVIESDIITFKAKAAENTGTEIGYLNDANTYYTGNLDDPELYNKLDAASVVYRKPVVITSPILDFIQTWILPAIIIYFILSFFMGFIAKKMGGSGGGGPMSFGKNTAKIYAQKETGVTFADVAGQDEAEESLLEIVDFLHNPEKYTAIGAKLPKGALLVGPPGTGKTLLAKAVAGEAKVPFYSLSGSDFVEMFVGVGASRVRDLFKQAGENAPCIIFIDEIDAIGKSRDNQLGSNDEREQTLNQLLSEMDGFDASKGVVILGATNRPEVLDKALLRPGRFDRRIIVEKPDLKGREEILKVHLKDVKAGNDVDIHKVALATSGGAGADIANIVNEAALRAVRMGRTEVSQEDFMEAVEIIIAGKEKKDRILKEEEKKLVTYHEIGHALVSAKQKNSQPVQKITIVPRTMGALGYTMQMPEEEKYLMSKDEMLDEITVLLGGRAAEEVVFNTATTGAANDIERASAMARSMVTQYGMSERFDMVSLESVGSKYLDGRSVKNCAETTAAEIDEEVLKIISACHKKAISLLTENRDVMDKTAEFLFEKETITGEEFMRILKDEELQKEDN